VVIGHLPAGLIPGRLGQLRVPAIERKPNLNRVQAVTPRHTAPGLRNAADGDPFEIADSARWADVPITAVNVRGLSGYVCAALSGP
jgi:hypothetical protein